MGFIRLPTITLPDQHLYLHLHHDFIVTVSLAYRSA